MANLKPPQRFLTGTMQEDHGELLGLIIPSSLNC
ncbi:unnamed protein product, partial [Rotaria magnacalcarata]